MPPTTINQASHQTPFSFPLYPIAIKQGSAAIETMKNHLPTSSVTVPSLRVFIHSDTIKPTPPLRNEALSVLLPQGKKKRTHKWNQNKPDNPNGISESCPYLCPQWFGPVNFCCLNTVRRKDANVPHRFAMSGMAPYAPVTPPGTCSKNAAGNFWPSSFVSTTEPSTIFPQYDACY
jgi:hypothetical protein